MRKDVSKVDFWLIHFEHYTQHGAMMYAKFCMQLLGKLEGLSALAWYPGLLSFSAYAQVHYMIKFLINTKEYMLANCNHDVLNTQVHTHL